MLCARWFAGFRRKLTFETLSRIAHSDASSLRYSDFDVWMKFMSVTGERWQHCSNSSSFSHATYCGSVTIIRASDETSDALFKRVKPCFGFCWWTNFVWCLYLLSMTINIASSSTDASAWIMPSSWIGNDSWWSWFRVRCKSSQAESLHPHNGHGHPTDPRSERIRNMCERIPFQTRANACESRSFLPVTAICIEMESAVFLEGCEFTQIPIFL